MKRLFLLWMVMSLSVISLFAGERIKRVKGNLKPDPSVLVQWGFGARSMAGQFTGAFFEFNMFTPAQVGLHADVTVGLTAGGGHGRWRQIFPPTRWMGSAGVAFEVSGLTSIIVAYSRTALYERSQPRPPTKPYRFIDGPLLAGRLVFGDGIFASRDNFAVSLGYVHGTVKDRLSTSPQFIKHKQGYVVVGVSYNL